MNYTASPQFRGYMKIGVENTAGLVDFREQIEFGPEENAEANSGETIFLFRFADTLPNPHLFWNALTLSRHIMTFSMIFFDGDW